MTLELSPSIRQAIALTLLGVLLAVIWFCVLQPVSDYIDENMEGRGLSIRALKRNRALLREGPTIEAAHRSVEQSARWRNFYDGNSSESATLQLETDLRGILKDSNNPTSMIPEQPSPMQSVTRIAVRLTLSMRVDQLADALDRIQKQPRQLVIDSLIIQAPDYQPAQTNPILTIQAEISAMALTAPQDGGGP